MTKVFNENTKLADAITSHPALIRLLPRFNMQLGFGDKSIKSVCEYYNVPTNLFLLVCNIYAFDNYRPSIDDITSTDNSHLITYLEKSHIYYIEKRIPHIESHLIKIADQLDPKHGTILVTFFNQYKKEVQQHFSYEENIVFPLIKGCQDESSSYTPFDKYAEEHTNIEDALDDLIQIVFKYLPSNIEHDNTIGMAFDILQLTKDLKKHALIEERILIPFLEHLERGHEK